jgi:hypothetical protein
MKFNITGRNVNVTDGMKDMIDKKCGPDIVYRDAPVRKGRKKADNSGASA